MVFKALLICIGLFAASHGAAANESAAPPEIPAPAVEHVEHQLPPPVADTADPAYEVRIVIDTSGSMKQTDPLNLRVPALKLLVNLLPAGTRAGVWTFDTAPRELVPVSPVDAEWKEKAAQASSLIHSKGDFTNIETALSTAAAGWLPPAARGEHRRLILLTDGMVDVSKNAQESTASREAILNRLLPALQQAGVEIHTIALSSKADEALLRHLALSTNGWNAVAQDAEQLQRAFLQLFDQSVPHDSIPIRDNRFTLDASVEEFTLLVVLQPGAEPTRLTAPDGHVFTHGTVLENTHWLHEASFDLVTISRPLAGEWQLEAKQDPSNQVLVVSNLKMEPLKIPNYLEPGDKVPVGAVFTDKNQPITREDFLALLKVTAELSAGADRREFSLAHEPARPGVFSADAGGPLPPGDYTLLIAADGKTFQRQTRQTFRVMPDLLRIETRADDSSQPPGLSIVLEPNTQNLSLDGLDLRATLTDQAGQSRPLMPERVADSLQIKLPAPAQGEQWIVNFEASGKTPDGAAIDIPLKPVTLTGASPAPVPTAPTSAAPSPAAAMPETASPAKEANWALAAGIALAVNALILLAMYGVSRLIRRRRAAAIAALLDKFTS